MRIPVPDERLPAEQLGHVHFVGIGGAGLSAIARIMLERGISVSGSDANSSPLLEKLRSLGATCHVGHDATQLAGADTLIVSTAIPETNPEVVEAARLGLRVLPRSAGLDSVMIGHRVIAVAGTHGKTTTTSLLTVALQGAGADPSYTIGGELASTGTNARVGKDDLFVAEADESDGAFLVYSPYAAIVTNVEADHLDIWETPEKYADGFVQFVEHIDPSGFLVCGADDPGAAKLADAARARGIRTVTVGQAADSDVRIVEPRVEATTSTCRLIRDDAELGELVLRIPGVHYLLDAACALAAGLELGYPFDGLRAGVAGYAGTRRRMELKGEADGVRVYDSYAHHPTEIRSDVAAGRALAGSGRLIVCFQPHMFSRTRIFAAEMARELGAADDVVLMDVYPAREKPEPGVDGGLVARQVPAGAEFVPDRAYVVPAVAGRARPGDVVLTLGAGDVTEIGPELIVALQHRAAEEAG